MRSPSRFALSTLVLTVILLLLLLMPALAGATVAPIDLGARFDETGIGNSMAVVSGDFDRDGKLDVASATVSEGTVTVSLGNGDGTFGSPSSFTVAAYSMGVAAGDLDFDGDLDLVSVCVEGTMSVLLGDGGGSFAAHVDYTVGAGTSGGSVSLADVDRDGDLDAVVCDGTGVGVCLNNGDGTFAAVTRYAHGASNHVLVADLDGDSSPDLVSTSYESDTVAIWLNDGSGGFGSPDVIPCAGQPWGAGAGDFDHDGDADLLVPAYTGNAVYLLLNDGSGSFSIPMSVATAEGASYVVVEDFNRDGDLDAAVGGYLGSVFMLRGNGSGSFAIESYPSLAGIWDMDGADFNADGLTDVVASSGSGGFTAYLNTSGVAQGVAYGAPVTVDVGLTTRSTCTGDLDADGDADVVACREDGVAVPLFNDGTGSFTAGLPISLSWIDGGQSRLVDIDRDGDLDLVASGYFNAGIAVAYGNGDGIFGSVSILPTPSTALHCEVADLNLDGYLDIVAPCESANVMRVFLNDRSGGFPSSSDYATDPYPAGVCCSDFDRDGKPDIAIVHWGSDRIMYFWGSGSGVFGSGDPYPLGSQNWLDLEDADFDHDGAVDLAVGHWDQSVLLTFLNPSRGLPADAVTTTNQVWSIEAADISRDGNVDLLCSNGWIDGGNPGFTILPGNGDGSFAAEETFWHGSVTTQAALADVNADGRLDILAPSTSGTSVGVFTASLPTGDVEIDGGAASCFSRIVTLDLASASGVEYRARNRGGDWSAWTSFAASVPWRLTSGAGVKEVEVQYRDASGNLSDAVSDDIDYAPETTAPTSSQTGGDAWYDVDATVSFSAVDDPGGSGVDHIEYSLDDGGTWTTGDSVTIPAPSDGSNDSTFTVQYRAVDNADNVEDPANTCWVGIDTQAPSTSDDAPSGWVSSDTTVNFWSGDVGCGVRYTQYKVDDGLWKRGTSVTVPVPGDGSNDGIHKIRYRSVDLVLNIEETHTTWLRAGPPEVHVTPDGSDTVGLGTEAQPFLTIGHAMDLLLGDWPGETIRIHSGSYAEDVVMKSGVTLFGDPGTTTISGTGTGPVVTASGLGSGVFIHGLTITGGSAVNGGGVFVSGVGTPSTVDECVVTGNTATGYGGGIFAGGLAEIVVDDSTVANNVALNSGGGIGTDGAGSVYLTDTTFEGNVVNGFQAGAAGLWRTNMWVAIERCRFVDNYSATWVGAVTISESSAVSISDSLFVDNHTSWGDYGTVCLYFLSAPATVERCTFVGNASYGGVINSMGSPPASVNSCILRDGAPGWPELVNANAVFSNIQGGYAGTGNIDADPLFVDPGSRDYHLQDGSPCIGGGDPAAPGSYDLDQIPRPQADNNGGEGYLDMGCFERPSFVLQAGAVSTWFTRVECDSMFSIGTEMRFRNPGGDWSDWEPFNTTRVDWPLDISGGDGPKWVEAEYRYLDTDGVTRVLRQADSIDYTAYVGDTTPPATTVYGSDADWHGEDVELYVEALDPESGVERTYIDVDGNGYYPLAGYYVTVVAEPDGSNDGIHHISYFSDDWAGNRESAGVVDVKIDTQAPSTTLSGLTDGWLSATAVLGLDVSDARSGPALTRWRFDGTGPWHVGTVPDTSGLGEGDHSIEFYSIDAAGNIEDVQTTDFSVDLTPPSLSDDASGDWVHEEVIQFSGTDAGSGGIHDWQYRIDGGAWRDGDQMRLSCSLHKTRHSGDYLIEYRARDAAGNTGSGECHGLLDGIAPQTTASGLGGPEPLTVTLAADDAHSGPAHTYYSTDDGATWTEGTSVTFTGVGEHRLRFYSDDAAGNREAIKTRIAEVGTLFFDTTNGATAYNYEWAGLPTFTTTGPTRVVKIVDYHFNDGYGSSPSGQSIWLYRVEDGSTYGPWPTSGLPSGWPGDPIIMWDACPLVTVPAGTYQVNDSQRNTWSTNPESGWTFFTWVYTRPLS